jgi:excisionase family DNA binding protein
VRAAPREGRETARPVRGRALSEGALRLEVPPELVDAIAARAAELVFERLAADVARDSKYVTVAEAAAILRAKPQRVYDLLSDGRLTRHKDGSRVLVDRRELDGYLGNCRPL